MSSSLKRRPMRAGWAVVGAALWLSACGGGGRDSAASGVQGVAAVGDAVAGGSVAVACASGTHASTTTDASGRYAVALAAADYPCLLQLRGGTVHGSWNGALLHSAALKAGTVNVTPLTELALAAQLQDAPSTRFAGADAGLRSALTASALQSSQVTLQQVLASVNIQLPAGTDVFVSAFKPEVGDPVDGVLTALGAALKKTGTDVTAMSAFVSGRGGGNPLLGAQPSGGLVLQYDPIDPDVLLAVPLTKALQPSTTVQAVGDRGRAIVSIVGSPKTDAVAGVTTGPVGAIRFSGIEGLERLDTTGWQLYLEVDRATFSVLNTTSAGSGGVALEHEQALVSLRQSVGANGALAYNLGLQTNKAPVLAVGDGSHVGTVGIPYTDVVLPKAKTHVPITVWSDGQHVGLVIDGIDCGSVPSEVEFGIARLLEVGASNTARVRRLMLVARKPTFTVHPRIRTMAVLGDSYAQFERDYGGSSSYSASTYLQAMAKLTRAGRRISWPSVIDNSTDNQSFAGHHLMGYNTAEAPLGLAVAEDRNGFDQNLWDKKAAMLKTYSPDLLVMQVGANDVSSLDGSEPDIDRWRSWVGQWICWALGECGYEKNSIRKLAFSSTPWSPDVGGSAAFRAARRDKIAAMRDAIQTAIQQFIAAHPERANDVTMVDQFAAFGGTATDPLYFSPIDSPDGGGHPSLLGNMIKGQAWGDGVLRLLSTP